jgi:hypothetical protein
MARGKTLDTETRPLNVRVDVDDLKTLQLLQIVTGTSTADVVRESLKEYIGKNRKLLTQAGEALVKGGGK